MTARRKRGFTLIELLAAVAVISLLVGLLLPAVQQAREAARQAQCRGHLKQLGLALHGYHATHGGFPVGVTSTIDGSMAYGNANIGLLPFLEQAYLYQTFDPSLTWDAQSPDVARMVISGFVCPSNSKDNPHSAPALAGFDLPIGTTFGATDYVYCKGATDAWCLPLDGRPRDRGGMFDVNQFTRIGQVTDGSSATIAMGEGAGGPAWPLGRGPGATAPFQGSQGVPPATNAWIMGVTGNQTLQQAGYLLGGIWGATIDPPNKRPVTDTWVDVSALDDCRASLDGGPHSVANFRSDHHGSVMFLFADGAVRPLGAEIDLRAYRRLSTVAEGGPSPIP